MQNKQADNLLMSFRKDCEKYNLKFTHQRFLIYKVLFQSKDHPSIDVIFKKVRKTIPSITFNTVYRTVITFVEKGIIDIVNGYIYSKRFDANKSEHHHLICRKCHKIIDFYSEYYDSVKIPPGVPNDFTVLKKRIWLEGLCVQCS